MIVEDLTEEDMGVRADSPEAKKGFKLYDEREKEYDYFLPLLPNVNLDVSLASYRVSKISDYVLVVNLKCNTIGIIHASRMVEPVNMKVLVTA